MDLKVRCAPARSRAVTISVSGISTFISNPRRAGQRACCGKLLEHTACYRILPAAGSEFIHMWQPLLVKMVTLIGKKHTPFSGAQSGLLALIELSFGERFAF
jgi:hypothetical protein